MPFPLPKYERAGRHHGIQKIIRRANERSSLLYKEAVGVLWKEAKLMAVDKMGLKLQLRGRVWH